MATPNLRSSAPALLTTTTTTVQFPAGRARYVVCVGAGAEILAHRTLADDEIVISAARLEEIAEQALALHQKALRVRDGGGADE